MNNEVLHIFLLEQLKSVERHLKDLSEDSDLEHLHRLRVSIKKIRSLLSFIKYAYSEKFDFRLLENLFKKAGEIREIQINIDLIKTLPKFPLAVIDDWKKIKERRMKNYLNHIPEYITLVRRFRKKTFLTYHMPNEIIIQSYIRKIRLKATKRFHSKNRNDMHRFRKLIKKLIYMYELLPERSKKVAGIDLELIHKIQSEVGTWHDTYAAISFIKRKKSIRH